MAVAYQSDGGGVFAAANNNNAITVPLPPTRPVGSVLLLAAFCRLITAAAPTITGYTLLGTWTSGTANGGRMWLYGRIVDGTESAPSVTPVGVTGTSGDIFGAGIVCYSGVDTSGGITAIFDGTPTVQDASGTTTCTYPALTISRADSMIMRFLSRYRDATDTFTPTATWNERADLGSTNRLGGQFHMQDKLATASGAQASVTVAPSNTTAARYLAVTLALKAAQVTTTQISLPASLSLSGSNIAFQKIPAFPTVGIADDFNRADQYPPGSSWKGSSRADGWCVRSNHLEVDAAGAVDVIYWDTTTPVDQEAFVVVGGVGNNLTSFDIQLRRDHAADTAYAVRFIAGLSSTVRVEIYRRVTGSETLMQSISSFTCIGADSLGASIAGDKIYVWHKPSAGSWRLLGTANDSTITAAGKIALADSGNFTFLDFGGPPGIPTTPISLPAGLPLSPSLTLKKSPTRTSVTEISLADDALEPKTRTGHEIVIRARKTVAGHSGYLSVRLLEGGIVRVDAIPNESLTSVFQDMHVTIYDIEAASITNYGNLSVQIQGVAPFGDPLQVQVSQVYLSTPKGIPPPTKISLPSSLTATPTLAKQATFERTISATPALTPVISDIATHYKAVPAGLILTPATIREPSRLLVSSLVLTPALVSAAKKPRALDASLVLTPVISKLASHYLALSAALALNPALAKEYFGARAISASLTLTPALNRKLAKAVVGSLVLTPVISDAAIFKRALAAGLVLTPALQAQRVIVSTPISLAASLPLTMAMLRELYFAPAASLILIPALIKEPSRSFPASLVLSSAIVREMYEAFPVGLTLTPVISDIATHYKVLTSALTLSPTLARQLTAERTLAAGLTLTPALNRKLQKILTVSLPLTLSLIREMQRPAFGVANLVLTPTMTPLARHWMTLSAGISLNPSIAVKIGGKMYLAADLLLNPALVKEPTRFISASLVLSPVLTQRATHFRAMSAGLTLTAVLVELERYRRTLSAVLSLSPALTLALRRRMALSASTGLTAALNRKLGSRLSANLPLMAVLGSIKTQRVPISLAAEIFLLTELDVNTAEEIELAAELRLLAILFAVVPPILYPPPDEIIDVGLNKPVIISADGGDEPEIISVGPESMYVGYE